MALSEYLEVQMSVMALYFIMHGVNPDVDSPERRELEMAWIENGHSKKFRDTWMERERKYNAKIQKQSEGIYQE